MLGREDTELWMEVELLGMHCDAGLWPGHPLRELMRRTLDLPDDGEPDPAALAAARDAFYSMSPELMRHVLNGWRPRPERPTHAGLFEELETMPIERVLEVYPWAMTRGGECRAFHEFDFYRGSSPVRVTVREGSTLSEVLGTLAEAMAHLAKHWPELIADEQWSVRKARAAQRKKEGDASRRPNVPQPASKRNAKARTPAAA